jgi:hypothetical protein
MTPTTERLAQRDLREDILNRPPVMHHEADTSLWLCLVELPVILNRLTAASLADRLRSERVNDFPDNASLFPSPPRLRVQAVVDMTNTSLRIVAALDRTVAAFANSNP